MTARAAIRLDELLEVRAAIDATTHCLTVLGCTPINDPLVERLIRARSTLTARFSLDKLVEVDILNAQQEASR